MTHRNVMVATMLCAVLVAISYDEPQAQQRMSCTQARAACGKQPVCQRRYETCMQTGCWRSAILRRCGYIQR